MNGSNLNNPPIVDRKQKSKEKSGCSQFLDHALTHVWKSSMASDSRKHEGKKSKMIRVPFLKTQFFSRVGLVYVTWPS